MARSIIAQVIASLILAAASCSLAAFISVFAASDECAFCHTSSPSTLIGSKGNQLSIADDWRSTMMGNSFHDPIFRAKVETEVVRNPQLTNAIEDKCLTCHAPMPEPKRFETEPHTMHSLSLRHPSSHQMV